MSAVARRVPSAECSVPAALLALVIATAPLSAQSVAAAGQPPAVPGRFGFSLECVNGCRWVAPGIDHSYFRFLGEPKVSAVKKGSAAQRAGLKVGDVIVDVDSEAVTSIPAGLALASDSNEMLRLGVKGANGRVRVYVLYTVSECRGSRGVVVNNHVGFDFDVMMMRGEMGRPLGRAQPGESEFPIPLSDSAYRARPPYFYGRLPRGAGTSRRAKDWRKQISFRVVCHD